METSLVFLFVCIFFMVMVIAWFWKIRHQQVNAIASIVTVLGVLGTFIGIVWGLWNFDAQDIEASVPMLLEGLKFAFTTSIAGIICSIAIKVTVLHNRKTQAESEDTYTGATVDDLAELLLKIYTVQFAEGKETREIFRSIEKALTGDGESTVLTQLQKLRTTFSDKQDDLLHAFKEFAANMAENNSKALIEALEEVMRDFNAKINEQFGDNFKRLNEAVEKILVWQDQYRQQMDELAEEFRVAAESIEQSRKSLDTIAERSHTIVSSAERLEPVLSAIQHQQQRLAEHLEAFNMLSENARAAFPLIEERLNQLTIGFSNVVKENIDNSHADMQRQRLALLDFTGRIENIIQSTNSGLESTLENQSQQLKTIVIDTNRGLEDTLQNQSILLETIVTDTSQHLQEMINRREQQTEDIFQESTNRMTQQFQVLDKALEEELTKSLESLGSQLTSLSRRFVDDYTPLTNKLREVVQIASRLPQTTPHLSRPNS